MDSNIIPSNLWCDVRQNILRQRRDGKMTMLSKSLAYKYSRDRCASGVEMFMHQGWSRDIHATDINARVPGWPDELRHYAGKKVMIHPIHRHRHRRSAGQTVAHTVDLLSRTWLAMAWPCRTCHSCLTPHSCRCARTVHG